MVSSGLLLFCCQTARVPLSLPRAGCLTSSLLFLDPLFGIKAFPPSQPFPPKKVFFFPAVPFCLGCRGVPPAQVLYVMIRGSGFPVRSFHDPPLPVQPSRFFLFRPLLSPSHSFLFSDKHTGKAPGIRLSFDWALLPRVLLPPDAGSVS